MTHRPNFSLLIYRDGLVGLVVQARRLGCSDLPGFGGGAGARPGVHGGEIDMRGERIIPGLSLLARCRSEGRETV